MLETFVANLTGKVRRENLQGRPHLVASATLIVPGVLNGSKGALLYTEEELGKNPEAWNGVPIVVYHPTANGVHVSARTLDVLNSRGVGIVLNSRSNGKLTAELWFEIEATSRVDNRILTALGKGSQIELSTGLFTDNEQKEGEFEGTSYEAIARNYRPDHLAILPDEKGACSIADGCGVLTNGIKVNELTHDQLYSLLSSQLRAKFTQDHWVDEVFDNLIIFRTGDKLFKLSYTKSDTEVVLSNDTPVEVVRETKFVSVNKEPNMNKLTDNQRTELANGIIANCDCWNDDDTDKETLNGFTDEKLNAIYNGVEKTKRQLAVAEAAKKGFEHGDVGFTFNEGEKKWKGVENEKKEPKVPVANKKEDPVKPKTMEEWLEDAPAPLRNVVNNALAFDTEQKTQCIKIIKANKRNALSDEVLDSITKRSDGLTELQGIAAMAEPEAKAPTTNYFGAAAAPTQNVQTNPDFDEDDILPLPTVNYKEAKEA